jgi:protein-S-isoprenylcysteine O-methyltransferase Ste14
MYHSRTIRHIFKRKGMFMSDRNIEMTATVILMLCWVAFVIAFLFRKRTRGGTAAPADRKAKLGIIVQMIGFAIPWSWRREPLTSLLPFPGNAFLAIISILLAVGSVWLVMAAIRELGKFWALSARILDEHQLITTGPFSLVRHPIYTGMFGLLISTGLCCSTVPAILVAIAIYLAGFSIRAGREDALLLERFGEEFLKYREKTPALLPRVGTFH